MKRLLFDAFVVVLALLTGSQVAVSAPETKKPISVFVLAIGYPYAPPDAESTESQTLKYASSDAARFVEAIAGAFRIVERRRRLWLFAHFDTPEAGKRFEYLFVQPPSAKEISEAVSQIRREIERDNDEGRETHLFVYYAGHGRARGSMGHVYLAPDDVSPQAGVAERFTATDFKSTVFDKVNATRIHFVADACDAYYLMADRGGQPSQRRRRRQGLLGLIFAQLAPQVGVVLASSGPGKVYESELRKSGIVSFAIRSALAGMADLDTDGALSYEELNAFLREAFQGIKPLYRPNVYVQPPAADAAWNESWSKVQLAARRDSESSSQPPMLQVGGDGRAQHIYLEEADDMHTRIAETYTDGTHLLRLWIDFEVLKPQYPIRAYRRFPDGKHEPYRMLARGAQQWEPFPAPADPTHRGAVPDVAKNLFQTPIGVTHISEHKDRRLARALPDTPDGDYMAFRVTAGRNDRLGSDIPRLVESTQLTAMARYEHRGWVFGAGGELVLPTEMERGPTGSAPLSYGFGIDSYVARAIPLGPIQLEPRISVGPSFLFQTQSDATAWGVRAALGSAVMIYLPWNTNWALTLDTRIGPEYLTNLSFPNSTRTTDLAWPWALGLGLDWEIPL